jgi:hypothetical protein
MPAIEMAGFDCVSLACFPVIEISKWLVFDALPPQTPAVEMDGVATRS